jgi:iron complex outermembrane recepter protein
MKQVPIISAISVIATSLSGLQAQQDQRETFPPISTLDALVITANRAGQTLFQQIQPASVLTDDQLLLRIEPTLGETLNRLPGVSSTGFAPGASRPILRGLGDDRIRILQNGTSLLDVSNVSPDHGVSTDPLSISSVEVVRGPATLLYGPNTIGGVVNVIDNRIAEERFTGTYPTGSFAFSGGTADNSLSESAEITWGHGPLVFHLDAFHRDTEDIEIPGFARSDRQRALDDPADDQPYGTVPNSFSNSEGIGFGTSYIFEKGFLGFSYSGLNSDYGTVGEPDVTIGLEQRRWDMRGAVYEPLAFLREINFSLGYSDYTHTEFEGPDVGTVFEIEGFNGRLEFLHNPIAGFEGTIGYEIQASDFSALGDEAFLPPVTNSTNSLFFFEEKEFGKTRFQFGARYDHQSNETNDSAVFGPSLSRDFDAFSASAGIIYNPTENYAISLSLAYSQRPPTYVELFANGPHVATSTFEVGDPDLGKEEAFSIDLSLRKKSGWVTGSASAFYYRFNDYISLNDTGGTDPDEDLPIFAFQPINADFYGFELEAIFHLLGAIEAPVETDAKSGTIPASAGSDSRLDLILRADYVHAENRDTGEAVPRIPPFRTSVALEYGNGPLTASIEGQYAAAQDHNAAFELPTDNYFLLGASISYKASLAGLDSTIYIKGVNLTDEEARLSTSFLKDVAPLAGRGVVVGLRTEF